MTFSCEDWNIRLTWCAAPKETGRRRGLFDVVCHIFWSVA